jgi:hypothetical protein
MSISMASPSTQATRQIQMPRPARQGGAALLSAAGASSASLSRRGCLLAVSGQWRCATSLTAARASRTQHLERLRGKAPPSSSDARRGQDRGLAPKLSQHAGQTLSLNPLSVLSTERPVDVAGPADAGTVTIVGPRSRSRGPFRPARRHHACSRGAADRRAGGKAE